MTGSSRERSSRDRSGIAYTMMEVSSQSLCAAEIIEPDDKDNGTLCYKLICPINQTCNEEKAQCYCQKGFIQLGNNATDCEDINECREKHNCGINSKCYNTIGSYFCKCRSGFSKDGSTTFCAPDKKEGCKDIDECQDLPSPCGLNSVCVNSIGSYSCTCEPGFRNISADTKRPQCFVRCENSPTPTQPCDEPNPLRCSLKNLEMSARPLCKGGEFSGDRMKKFLEKLASLLPGDSNEDKPTRLKFVGSLFRRVEVVARNLALLLRKNITHTVSNITLNILSRHFQKEKLCLSSNTSYIELDWNSAAEQTETDVAMVGFLEYRNLSPLLKDASILGEDSKAAKLISPVLSTFVTREDTKHLQSNIAIRLKHNVQVQDPNQTRCVFWSKDNSAWITEGCEKVESNTNETLCTCSHMTSFAILMALNPSAIESWTLSLITKIGLAISIVCLTVSIITFCFCRSIRGTRNTIHTHLCATILCGNCIFLLFISATSNKIFCHVVAGVLLALYLSAFCWMALEGLELYLMLVRVFDTHCLKKRHLVLVGYGVPAVIVVISAAVSPSGFGTKRYCWLSGNVIWSFMGPVCAIILVNCGIFVLTVWKLADKMASINPDQGKLKRIRSLTITSVAQLCILGCCWVFGFLMFGSATNTFAYIFSILNSLQGLQIFLLHCLMHRKVREEYAKWVCAAIHLKTSTYSEFSNSSNIQSQSKAKTSNKESTL
ncbi:adhesion G protein-coupled receptor E5 [Pelodytes ibericus]